MTIDAIRAVEEALTDRFPDAEVRSCPDDRDQGFCFRVAVKERIIAVLIVTFDFLEETAPEHIERQFRARGVERRLRLAGRNEAVLLTTKDVRVC